MTLEEASSNFERLTSATSKKNELRVYKEFMSVITELKKKNLSESEISMIEKELDSINFESYNVENKKYFNKALRQFKKYLKDTFSLITRNYYTNLGLGLGTTFGIIAGIVLLSDFERSQGISMGVSFGMLIGLIIGRKMDAQAMSAGRVI